MYTYTVKYYVTNGGWYDDADRYTNVYLYFEGAQVAIWTYRDQPRWLKRRLRILEKKYGATYADS